MCIKCYIREAGSFTVGKLVQQFYSHDHNPILYGWEGYKIWTMTLDLSCEESLGSSTDLAFARHRMQINHVRWDELVKCWKYEI